MHGGNDLKPSATIRQRKNFWQRNWLSGTFYRRSGMRRGALIAGLICLNLGLVAGLAYVWKGRNARPAIDPSDTIAASAERPSRPVTRTIVVPGNQPQNPSRFSWRFLESPDFKQYIANLRAVGCPEQTIQDIIIADVNKLYAGKEAALRIKPE